MKKLVHSIILLLIFSFMICGCSGINYDEYNDLEYEYEETLQEIGSLEEEIDAKNQLIELLFNYIHSKNVVSDNTVYSFNDVWSVGDRFDFKFCFDEEYECLSYDIKNKEGEEIFFIDEDTDEIQSLFIGVYRSDGLFESYNEYWDGNTLFDIPNYNYSYEIIVFATVDDKIHKATYNFSCEDIK